jgi:hypothetical protein
VAAPRRLPPTSTLVQLVEEGLTHQEIAERVLSTTGQRVSRSTVSVALSRAGLAKDAMRYKDELPWKVRAEHLTQYPARMLRLLGRRRAQMELNVDEDSRLDAWMESLEEHNLIVAYAPENIGFIYVDPDEIGDGSGGVPIRRRTIQPEEFPDTGERTGDL